MKYYYSLGNILSTKQSLQSDTFSICGGNNYCKCTIFTWKKSGSTVCHSGIKVSVVFTLYVNILDCKVCFVNKMSSQTLDNTLQILDFYQCFLLPIYQAIISLLKFQMWNKTLCVHIRFGVNLKSVCWKSVMNKHLNQRLLRIYHLLSVLQKTRCSKTVSPFGW